MEDNSSIDRVKQKEIARARESNESSDVIGERQHQMVGQFINEIINADDRLLEIGCGKGTLRKYINGKYHGVDPIELSKSVDFDFYQCCGENVPFVDQYFDLIVIKDGINYYSNLDLLFGEAVRLLKPCGSIVITEFVGKNYSSIRFTLKKFIKFRIGIMKNKWDYTYLDYYSHKDVIRYTGNYFKNIRYLFNSDDERYFVVATNLI